MTMRRRSPKWLATTALFALPAIACSGSVARVGGESHFVCSSDLDCPSRAPVCVRENPSSARGMCQQANRFTDVGAGGVTSFPDSSIPSGGTSSLGATAGPSIAPDGGSPSPDAGPGAGGRISILPDSGSPSPGVDDSPCNVQCCPTDVACYSSAQGRLSSGAECLATRDNTSQSHIQLRQTWLSSTFPVGNTIPLIRAVRAGRSELPMNGTNGTPNCNMGNGALGASGLIQLVDIAKDVTTIGYAPYVPPSTVRSTLTDGLCMVGGTYAGDPQYRLAGIQNAATKAWLPGLPPPMALQDAPWSVAPVRAKVLASDFDVAKDRTALLASLEKTGQYGSAGYNGVSFYDAGAGYLHAYAPLGWEVEYHAGGVDFVAVPIREAETIIGLNDAEHPNCAGLYGVDPEFRASGSCVAPADPTQGYAWAGGNCSHTTGSSGCTNGKGPAMTQGYALITELQQIFDTELGVTLCVIYPGQPNAQTDGFYDDLTKGCITSKWNPADPVKGLPHGDWCAATNAPATTDCHDAFRIQTFQTFSGAKIKLQPNGAEPMTCPL